MSDEIESPKRITDDLLKTELPPPTPIDTGFDENLQLNVGQRTDSPDISSTGPESMRGTLSRGGEAYDPARHAYPPEETPGKGKWKKRARAAGPIPATSDDIPNAQYRREAEKMAAMYAHLHVAVLGPDARSEPEELASMVDAWEAYFQTNGLKQVPPWAAVALTHGAYTHSVIKRPTLWPKVKKWFQPVTIQIRAIFGMENSDARLNSGEQLQRENKTGAETSSG